MRNAKVTCAFTVAVLVLSALHLQGAQAGVTGVSEVTAKEKLPAFLSDVLGFNLTSYNITNEGYGSSYPSNFGGQVKEEHYSFDLVNDGSQLSVGSVFDNGFISWLHLSLVRGAIVYAVQPSHDALVETRNILERYQVFAEKYGINASQVPQAISILDKAPSPPMGGSSSNFNHISDFTPANMTEGNMRMGIGQSSIGWCYTLDGVDMPNKGMGINFGYNFVFYDLWNFYSIGCLSVVSKEEAKSLMFEAAKNYAATVQIGTANGPVNITPNWTTVDIGLTMIPERQFSNELNNALGDSSVKEGNATRDPLKLYPYWSATFYFEPISNHQGVQVQMWGDTKEIAYITLYSVRPNALVPSTPTPEPTPTPTATPNSIQESTPSETPQPTKFPSTIWIFAILATMFALAAATLLIKRKTVFAPKPLMV